MEKFLLETDYGIPEETLKKLEEDIMNSLMSSMFGDVNISTSAVAIKNEPLTLEKLKEIQRQLEPYKKLREDFYKYSIPTYKLKFKDEEVANDFLNSRYIYGIPLIKPTKTIYIKIQARKHKQKRINKKWLKKYGYIEVPKEVSNYGMFTNVLA